MTGKLFVLSCLGLFCMGGCVVLDKTEELLALKRISGAQAEIQRYVDKQEECFYKLMSDFKKGSLRPGISKEKFVDTYGEPILSRKIDGPSSGEMLLYRHPTEYFSSDKIYLYFYESGGLASWEYKPYECKKRGGSHVPDSLLPKDI